MAPGPRAVESAVFAASLALTLSVAAATSVVPADADPGADPIEYAVFGPEDLHVVFQVPPHVDVAPPVEPEKQDPVDAFRGRASMRPLELVELLELVGFPDARTAWAVVMKESSGRPTAHNGNRRTGDDSYGLFQINMIDSLGVARREQFDIEEDDELFDPVLNAEIAFELSRGGTDFGPWGIGPNAYRGSTLGSFPRWYRDFPGGQTDE